MMLQRSAPGRSLFAATGLVFAAMVVMSGGARVAAAPTGQAAPGPFVKQAFDLLMDRFVTPPSSATILAGGWDGGIAFVRDNGGADVADGRPAFTGDRAGDWSAFLGAYPRLVAAAPGV